MCGSLILLCPPLSFRKCFSNVMGIYAVLLTTPALLCALLSVDNLKLWRNNFFYCSGFYDVQRCFSMNKQTAFFSLFTSYKQDFLFYLLLKIPTAASAHKCECLLVCLWLFRYVCRLSGWKQWFRDSFIICTVLVCSIKNNYWERILWPGYNELLISVEFLVDMSKACKWL